MSYINDVVMKHIRECDIAKTGNTEGMLRPPPPNTFDLSEIYAIGRAIISEVEGSISDKFLKHPTPCEMEGKHILHTHSDDYKEHDKMTTPELASHLNIPLWVVMEVARWEQAKEKVQGILDKERQAFYRLWHTYHAKYKMPYNHDEKEKIFNSIAEIFLEDGKEA